MKLTSEHLAPYLPYKLKVSVKSSLYPTPVLTGFNRGQAYFNYHGTYVSFTIGDFKPILRPLSDLEKEEWYNNFVFFYFDTLHVDRDSYGSLDDCLEYATSPIEFCPYSIYMWLIKNHFDIFDLIKQELAIDINTIKI